MTIIGEEESMPLSIHHDGLATQPDSSSQQIKVQEVIQLQNKENQHEMSIHNKQEPRAVYVALREPTLTSYDAANVGSTVAVDSTQNFNAFHDLTLIEATYPETEKKNNVVVLQAEGDQASRVVVQQVFDQQNVVLSDENSVAATLASLSATEVALPTEPLPLNELNNTTVEISSLDPMVVNDVSNHSEMLSSGFVLQPVASPDHLDAIRDLPRTRHHSNLEMSAEAGRFPNSYVSSSSRQRSCSTSSSLYSMVSSRSPNASPNSSSSSSLPSAKSLIVDDISHQINTGMNSKTTKRKTKNPIPDRNKDESYWRRRHKNNMAAKRSREAKRMKDDQMYQKSSILEERNKELSDKLENAIAEIDSLKQRLSKYEEI